MAQIVHNPKESVRSVRIIVRDTYEDYIKMLTDGGNKKQLADVISNELRAVEHDLAGVTAVLTSVESLLHHITHVSDIAGVLPVNEVDMLKLVFGQRPLEG